MFSKVCQTILKLKNKWGLLYLTNDVFQNQSRFPHRYRDQHHPHITIVFNMIKRLANNVEVIITRTSFFVFVLKDAETFVEECLKKVEVF